MAKSCGFCGKRFGFGASWKIVNGAKACGDCVKSGKADEDAPVSDGVVDPHPDLIVTTTPALEGRTVTAYVSTVSTVAIHKLGLVAELGAGLGELFGTHDAKYAETFRQLHAVAIARLKTDAHERGANAIIGAGFDVSFVESAADRKMMIAAHGTAVVVV